MIDFIGGGSTPGPPKAEKNTVVTEEVGTGKWFPIVEYTPGTATQHADALELANALRAMGLHAHITGFKGA